MNTLEAWNHTLFRALAAPPTPSPWLDSVAAAAARGGPTVLACALVTLWLWGRPGERPRLALLEATEAGLLGLGVNQLIGLIYFHPRPYMLGIARPLLSHAYETSFPSDHATLLFAVGLYLYFWTPRKVAGIVGTVLALLTSWGRVYAGIHFPFDILGSLAVAAASAVVVAATRRRTGSAHHWLAELYARVFAGWIRRGWVQGTVPVVLPTSVREAR